MTGLHDCNQSIPRTTSDDKLSSTRQDTAEYKAHSCSAHTTKGTIQAALEWTTCPSAKVTCMLSTWCTGNPCLSTTAWETKECVAPESTSATAAVASNSHPLEQHPSSAGSRTGNQKGSTCVQQLLVSCSPLDIYTGKRSKRTEEVAEDTWPYSGLESLGEA